MPHITDQERNDIEDFLNQECFGHDDYGIMSSRITVIRSYISDGPSWTGDVFFIVWGEVCFITIVGKKSHSDTYEVLYNIQEDQLTNIGGR